MVVEGQFVRSSSARTEVVITGLPDAVTRESRGRLLCALRETRLQRGGGRFFLNLVPAARPKSGEVLDLPLVLAGAGAVGHLDQGVLDRTLFLGEVGIDGTLHGVPGGLAAARRTHHGVPGVGAGLPIAHAGRIGKVLGAGPGKVDRCKACDLDHFPHRGVGDVALVHALDDFDRLAVQRGGRGTASKKDDWNQVLEFGPRQEPGP